MSSDTWLILIILALLVLLIFIFKKFKFLKVGSMAMVTGGVKCGKTTLAVYLAIREYKARLRSVKFKNFFRKLFRKNTAELPLLYSNIPLSFPYVQLTKDLLLRKKRFVYGSVILCSEYSLVADSQLIKDLDRNEQLLLFNKLIGHETKGGCIIFDTQCIQDCHYATKRCISQYFYIESCVKWLPFFVVANVREDRYSDDGTVVSVNTNDLEETTKKVLIPKSVWKKFDTYCYSILTDSLSVEKDVIKTNDLKARYIVSFKDYKNMYGGKYNEKKDNS